MTGHSRPVTTSAEHLPFCDTESDLLTSNPVCRNDIFTLLMSGLCSYHKLSHIDLALVVQYSIAKCITLHILVYQDLNPHVACK